MARSKQDLAHAELVRGEADDALEAVIRGLQGLTVLAEGDESRYPVAFDAMWHAHRALVDAKKELGHVVDEIDMEVHSL